MKLKNEIHGFNLLKIIMSFEVVLCHFWTTTEPPILLIPFYVLRKYAVCCFCFISFYLLNGYVEGFDSEIKKKRMKRLVWPHIIWTFLYFFIYWIFKIENNQGMIKRLLLQLLFGHTINPTMWFQIDLIIITGLVFVFNNKIKLKKQIEIGMLSCLIILCFIIQYSQVNYHIFIKLPNYCRYTLGRIAEMAPFALTGILIKKYDIYNKMPLKPNKLCIECIGCVLVSVASFILPKQKGFGYSGISLYISSILMVTIFFQISYYMKSEKINKALIFISRFTMGVYYCHRLVGYLLLRYIRQDILSNGWSYVKI